MTADKKKRKKERQNFIPPKTDRLQLINPVFWYRYCAQVDTTVLPLKIKIKTQYNKPHSANATIYLV